MIGNPFVALALKPPKDISGARITLSPVWVSLVEDPTVQRDVAT